jgi:hypothetical protein
MNFDKLAELTKKRSELCKIQENLTNKTYTLGIVFDGSYSRHLSDLLDEEIAKELKLKAQQFYEEKIQKINKEITKLCQEP